MVRRTCLTRFRTRVLVVFLWVSWRCSGGVVGVSKRLYVLSPHGHLSIPKWHQRRCKKCYWGCLLGYLMNFWSTLTMPGMTDLDYPKCCGWTIGGGGWIHVYNLHVLPGNCLILIPLLLVQHRIFFFQGVQLQFFDPSMVRISTLSHDDFKWNIPMESNSPFFCRKPSLANPHVSYQDDQFSVFKPSSTFEEIPHLSISFHIFPPYVHFIFNLIPRFKVFHRIHFHTIHSMFILSIYDFQHISMIFSSYVLSYFHHHLLISTIFP